MTIPVNKPRFFLISNMYPSENHPSFGIFVKKTEDLLTLLGGKFKYKAVIKGKGSSIFQKINKYIVFYIDIIKYYLKNDYDIIYIHYIPHSSLILIFLYFFKKKKIIINYHGGDLIPLYKVEKMLQPFSKYIASKSIGLIVPSNYFKQILISKYKYKHEADIKKIVVYPSAGIDSSVFYPIDKKLARQNIGLQIEEEIIIGYVSRIDKNKGWDIFLEATEILVNKYNINLKALVVGRGEETTAFKNKVDTLGIENNIVFLNERKNDELNYIYNSLDIFIFPTKLPESLGLVGLEAMACGLPVIATNIGGIPDFLKEKKNGFLFRSGETEELVGKILYYLQLGNEQKKIISSNAVLTSQEFSSIKCTTKLMNDLDNILHLIPTC